MMKIHDYFGIENDANCIRGKKNKKKEEFSNQMRGNYFLSNEIMVWKKL